MRQTIFALATAAGRAAVAVIRISGPGTRAAVEALAGSVPPARQAGLRGLRHDGVMLDEALVLFFQGPASYTGEDAAEFHVHGGRAVVESVLSALAFLGLRLAEPGEFTRRAFENGKLDLAQAEGVGDLIDAETEGQRRQALGQLGGALSQRYERWRDLLVHALAMLEAAVDFPDEDLPEAVAQRARPGLQTLADEIDAGLADLERGRRVRDGFRIALLGEPNAGKSTVLNGLAERDAAIVTATPGTTRDIIEVPLALGGYRVLLADTAGLRETDDLIEAEGVRRARAWAEAAGLRLWVVDAARGEGALDGAAAVLSPGDGVLINKTDLVDPAVVEGLLAAVAAGGWFGLALSAASDGAIGPLRLALTGYVRGALEGSEFPVATRLRHAERLKEARVYLGRALSDGGLEVELAAEDVRMAARALSKITGRVDPEDVLEKVFSSFCIGK
jgi:tRNA modification GTPase